MINYKKIYNEYNDTQWEIDEKKFENISSSPVCSDIYQIENLDNENIIKLKKDINYPLHKDLVDKISKFLNKNGCFLVTGFRGVGKSSVVNRAIAQYKFNLDDPKQTKYELVLVTIPLEQSLDLFSLVRIIFRNIFFHFLDTRFFKDNIGKIYIKKNTGAITCSPKAKKDGIAKAIIQKLETLYYGLEIYVESIREPKMHAGLTGLNFNILKGGGSVNFSKGQKTFAFPKATTSHLIYELKDFINLLNSKKYKFIFVFDELDRLKSQEEIIEEKGKEKTEIYLMEMLVKELKVLFNQSKANFIFIAGVDMYEKWQAEKSRGDGIYEGIFSDNFYVTSLLTKRENQKSKLSIPAVSDKKVTTIDDLNKQYIEIYSPILSDNPHKLNVNYNDITQKFIIDLLSKMKGPDRPNIFPKKVETIIIPGTFGYYLDTDKLKITDKDFQFKFSDMEIKYNDINDYLKNERLTGSSIKDIKAFISSITNEFTNFKIFKDEFIELIELDVESTKDENEIFESFFTEFFPKDAQFFFKNDYTIMLQSFCRYIRYKSRGILRKIIKEVNNFVVVKGNKMFLYISSYEAQKIKFFSGVEKLIQTKMPAHYYQNDKNKVLLYSIIDNAFKFYRIGLNLEEWETFSILPDREKVLIDKKIYNDALDILKGNYIELSFGRKTLFQFTPKYSRQIEHIIKKIPHEQHNFNISLLDYNEHLKDLQIQQEELNEESPKGIIFNTQIQVQIGKIYAKLNNPLKALNYYKIAIKHGIDQVENIIQKPENVSFRLHDTLLILDLICECYIEIGLLEFKLQNNKKAISYLWSGVKVFLDFYEWLVNHFNFKGFKHEPIKDVELERKFFDSNPFTQDNKEEIISFFSKLLDNIFYKRAQVNINAMREEIKVFNTRKKVFLDDLRNESTPKKILKIQNKTELKHLLQEYFRTNLKDKEFDRKLEDAFFSIGFDHKTTFKDKGELGFFSSYLILLNQKLLARNLPEFFSPKLLYCINTLSTVYSRLGQFELSAQLLKSGLTIADNTSFQSNAFVQRLQLALFYLLRFDFIKSLKYYQTTFRHLNVQKKYGQSDYYMNNELLAGIFDMVGILQSTLVPFEYGSSGITVNNIVNWNSLLNEISEMQSDTKHSTKNLLLSKLKESIQVGMLKNIDENHLTDEMKADIVGALNTIKDNLKLYLHIDKVAGSDRLLTPEIENELINLKENFGDLQESENKLSDTQKEEIKWFNIKILNQQFPDILSKNTDVKLEIKKKIYLLYSFTAQNYYMKEENKRKNIGSKLKLVKSLIYQSINEFYLIKVSKVVHENNIYCFFSIISESVTICKDILTMGRNKNYSKQDAKIEFSIVRNSGEALSYLGEISLILSRVPELLNMSKEFKTTSIVKEELVEITETLQIIWKDVSIILKEKDKYCLLENKLKNFDSSGTNFYILSEKFLRLGERFLASFYMPESNNIPLRLGMTFYFCSLNDLIVSDEEFKKERIELLELSAMYLKKAIKGFGEYQDFEHSSEEWIVGAYSDLGNTYHKIYEYLDEVKDSKEDKIDLIYFLKLAIDNYKNSLEIFTIRMNDLFASLTGKEPKLRVSLDSLFDTDYCFYLFQKLSRKMVSSNWKKQNLQSMDKIGNYGFYADTALIHDIGKYLKKCLYGSTWDITLEEESEKLQDILEKTKYLSNIFRNFGGIENQSEINNLRKKFKDNYPKYISDNYQTDPFWKLINILNNNKMGELRTEAWPIGGYRFIVDDETTISEEIENFTKEYVEFRNIIYMDQMI